MIDLTKYSSATDNKYFSNGSFNFKELADNISIKFVAELKGKLMLSKINRLAISQLVDGSKFIYIYASHYDYTNDSQNYLILDCYFIADGYYNIKYVSSNALKALDLTVSDTQI